MTVSPVESLVRSSDVALAAVELPSGRFLAVNALLASVLGGTVEELTGSSSLDQMSAADRPAARRGFQALADGDLTGYQAIRRLAGAADQGQFCSVWVTTVEIDGARVGLASVLAPADRDSEFGVLAPLSSAARPGHVVLGTVDGDWRIDRISQDVTSLLGITPEQCVAAPILGVVHPSDAPALLSAAEHARRGERAVRLTVRVAARVAGGARKWTEVTAVLAAITRDNPPSLGFALIRGESRAASPADVTREMQLEAHMLRIADELQAAGVIPRLDQLPALADAPQLGELTSREWSVLTRLLDGQRVAAIAAALFVSRSTVRNHLSSIYGKLGVHSQVELIRMLRGGAARGTRGE